MKMSFTLCVLLALLASPQLLAHVHLTGSDPADGSSVTSAPQQIELQYSEPLEVRYSNFSLHHMGDSHAAEMTPENVMRTGSAHAGNGESAIVLPVGASLEPGWYGIKWEALSTDGHLTEGVLHFHIDE